MTITVETICQGLLLERTYASSLDDASRALDSLDGLMTTVLTIHAGDQTLFVGGGPHQFTVTLLDTGGKAFDQVGAPAESGELLIVVGGQQMLIPRRLLLSRDEALLSIGRLMDGSLDPSLDYEFQA